MLPKPIIVDLFDIEYKPSRTAIDHIADIIENHGFVVTEIKDYDIRIWFPFRENEHGVEGTLIIDRMDRTFEISAKKVIVEEINYAPLATKDFERIEEFLKLLKKDISSSI
jgi:hypothetical protein